MGSSVALFSIEQVQSMLKTGFIDDQTRCWGEGMPEWLPVGRIEEVLDFAGRIEARQNGMVQAVRAGRSVEDVMHDKEFAAIAKK